MFYTIAECHSCGEKKVGHDCLPVIEVYCMSCGSVSRLCPECRNKKCGRCGGKLKPLWVIGSKDLTFEIVVENLDPASPNR